MTTQDSTAEAVGTEVGRGEKAVRNVIRRSSLATSMLTLEPVPFLDTAIFVPIQHRMVHDVACLRGYELDGTAIHDAFRRVRGRFVAPNATIAVAKIFAFVPVVPDLVSGAVAYALTSTIGELTDRYFRTGCSLSDAELRGSFDAIFKDQFRVTYRERRDELRAMFRCPRVRREFGELKQAYRRGEIGTDELSRRMTAILDDHERGACEER
jgi:uncharacterized protein (DUF697 family)